MKFLNVYCEKRKATVYISLDKIVLISANENGATIELQGVDSVHVATIAEELIRMVNGENKTAIGFRTNR
jgi:hypothetical protein